MEKSKLLLFILHEIISEHSISRVRLKPHDSVNKNLNFLCYPAISYQSECFNFFFLKNHYSSFVICSVHIFDIERRITETHLQMHQVCDSGSEFGRVNLRCLP